MFQAVGRTYQHANREVLFAGDPLPVQASHGQEGDQVRTVDDFRSPRRLLLSAWT